MSRQQAMALAEDAGKDLVEVQPQALPPVCRVMDYGKYQFEQQKRAHAARKKQRHNDLKEVQLRPVTDTADYQVKIRRTLGFLENGDRVKVVIRFRGREIQHVDNGRQMMARLLESVEEVGVAEGASRFEGKHMVVILAPRSRLARKQSDG